MTIIGITGGTGAGKSTALAALSRFNACVLDADLVYHALTQSSLALREALESRFGKLYDAEGLQRKKLGKLVFADATALHDLNQITHRFVGEEIDTQLELARLSGCRLAAIDAIGLIESGLATRCDATVAICAPEALRLRRIMAREGISEDYARLRIAAQADETYFRTQCDYTLYNDAQDTPESFGVQAAQLFEQICKEKEKNG